MKVSIKSIVLATASEREASLRAMNKNKDGVISKAEMSGGGDGPTLFQARQPGRAMTVDRARTALTLEAAYRLSIFDRTKDGFIDGNEVRSMSDKYRALVAREWALVSN